MQTAVPTLPGLIGGILWQGMVCIVGGGRGCRGRSDGGGDGNDDGRVIGGSSHKKNIFAIDTSGFGPFRADVAYI